LFDCNCKTHKTYVWLEADPTVTTLHNLAWDCQFPKLVYNLKQLKMKKLLFFLIGTLLSVSTYASHLLGGYIQTIQRGYSDTVDVTVTLFTDPQGVANPSTITIGEWKLVNGFYQSNSNFTVTQVSNSTWQGVNVYVYSGVRVLTSGDYRFIYTNCCRGMLTNASSSTNSNFTIALDYKKTAQGTTPNSAPVIINPLPIQWVTTNSQQSILFAVDLDGDSVRVVMDDAINQHANNTFVPLAPFTQLTSYGTYSVSDDGTIVWAPNTIGQFGTGYKIEEYRNGSLIGVNRVQQVFITQTGSSPTVPWPPIMIVHDMLYGNNVGVNITVSNASSSSMVIPGITVTQDTIDYWVLEDLVIGSHDGVIRVTNGTSNNDYRFTFKVVSTIGIEELSEPKFYQVWDLWGNLIYEGDKIPYNEMKGLYIVKEKDKIEKIWVVK